MDYGNLFFEFIWYIKEFRPRAFLIENVAGLLSVDDGVQVQKAVEELCANGYQVQEPKILNAASYGLPQHRQRVFLIGSRKGECPQFPTPDPYFVPCWTAIDCDRPARTWSEMDEVNIMIWGGER